MMFARTSGRAAGMARPCVVRPLHASAAAWKLERKKPSSALRVELFDFDEPRVRPPPAPVFPLLPVEALSPVAPSGWRAPAPQVAPTLPFRVHRSHANELPVYTEFKNKKARVSTVVRRVSGDLEAFQQELQRVVGPNATIRRRVASFEVYGEGHAPIISEWLIQCGF